MIPVGTPTSDISDAHPDLQICETQFTHYGARRRFGGPIRTLKCLGDTALLMDLLSEPGGGAVLVVDGEASFRNALLGSRHAAMAASNGWAGVVVYGAVRDVDEMAGIDLGVMGLGATPRRSGKTALGAVGVTVRFGGAEFIPHGYLWSDADGVVVAPAGWESDSLEPVAQRRGYNH